MSWSARFLNALADTRLHPLVLLRVVGVNDVHGLGYQAASDPKLGDPIIPVGGLRLQGSSLSPIGWRSTIGGFSVELAGSLATLKASVTRGTFVEALIGFPGWSEADYEVVARGQVQQLRSVSPFQGTLECRDLLGALRCRPTSTAGAAALGYRLDGGETTISADYSIGDTSLFLTNAGAFSYGFGSGAALVTPSGGGDSFVLTFSGKSGNELTGILAGWHGTADADAVAGSEVRPLWWAASEPSSIARLVLLSITGNGVHTFDTLPDGDGLGLPYSWVDHIDTAIYASAGAGRGTWEVISQEPVSDPAAWVQSWLAAGGMFITTRMGLLTVRAWFPAIFQGIPSQADITDADVVLGSWSVELWDPDHATEAESVRAVTLNGESSTTTEAAATLPSTDEVVYDLSDLAFDDESKSRTDILDRCYEVHTRIPERYTVTCAGLRLAKLANGDTVRVWSSLVAGRMRQTRNGLEGIAMKVVQVSPDFYSCTVTLTLLCYPTDAGAFP